MRKGTLIISIILTAALLFGLYSLLVAYRKAIQTAAPVTAVVAATAAAPTDNNSTQVLPTNVATEAPVAATITIYDAAALAAKVLGRSDLYTVENTQFNGADVYLATFRSGDIMYISLDGQVLSASKGSTPSIKEPVSHRGK